MEEADDEPLFCERAAGIDIGKQTVMVTVRVPSETRRGGRAQETREFGTTRRQLLELADWLRSWGVERAGMESTSDYWKPVFFLLEQQGFDCVLYPASKVKALPGRPKTDKLDSVWLAKVTERGSLAGSFVPPEDIRRLRTHTRYRRRLTQARTAEKQRAEKLLEDAQLTELLGRIAVSGGSARGRAVRFPGHDHGGDAPRDLSLLRVLRCGAVEATGDPFEPYRVVDVDGVVAAPVAAYLRDLQACGRPAATQRSYAMDLLRWFRFLRAVDVGWDQATRVEARDFCCWIQLAGKPGGPAPGARYAAATVAHCETVLRCFYDFHLEAGTGPMVNPFPLARGRRGRPNAHHNPMEPFRGERAGRYRPKTPRRIPRQIPDEKFDELFAGLGSHRDRALVAFWVSTGARAAELLGARRGDADPGQQLITVIRKGTRVLQPLPASPDAFVWLRLYQQQMHGLVPAGPDDPLWWTLRRPFRPLTYHAARAMFTRAGAALGGRWRLHDLRHTAAYRMARDPAMPLTDVQWVLGHAHLSTTQLYLTAPDEDVIAAVVAHHARRQGGPVGQGVRRPQPDTGLSR